MNDKIAELRTRASADPKSRHFYPLGEELRKSGALEEAESVLREGLANHPNYLSAWISLGRVLRDQSKHREAIEILQRAFSLDGSNVVTARLMAESYLALDDRVEAIKKFKLVRALLPPDEEVAEIIARLEREIQSESESAAPEPAADLEQPAASDFAPETGATVPEQDERESRPVSDSDSRDEEVWQGSDPSVSDEGAVSAQEQTTAASMETAAEETGPFDSIGDDTLSRASAARASEEDPFGFGAEPDSLATAEPASSDAGGPFDDESPFDGSDQGAAPLEADAQSAAIDRSADHTDPAADDAPDGRVVRLNAWLSKVRRNADVS